jgi:cytoskeleton protein RodZ
MKPKGKKNDDAPEPEGAEAVSVPPSSPPARTPKAEPGDFGGDALRRAREAAGLTLKDISERTKISALILGALEAENFSAMPGARVYVRGFVRCLARELDLDPDAVSKSYVPRWERWFARQRPS